MLLTAPLPHRSLIRISGADRLAFLQGLLSNDISKASATHAVYAALLTPQGKFLHDLFILEHDNAYLIDCESARAEDLINRLSAYKLRSKVTFENLANAYDVWAVWGGGASPQEAKKMDPRFRGDDDFISDPRLPDLGMRAFVPKGNPDNGFFSAVRRLQIEPNGTAGLPSPALGREREGPKPSWAWEGEGSPAAPFGDTFKLLYDKPVIGVKGKVPKYGQIVGVDVYDAHRLALGIADGSRDMDIEKSTLAEGNFDFLNGIDWKKGCYVGQELTARMHYRGLAKKRLFPVRIDIESGGKSPPYGATLSNDSGEMRSSSGTQGLALLKIDAVRQALDQETPLTHGNAKLWPSIPAWMKIDVQPANS